MSEISDQLDRDKQAIAESAAAASDTLTAALPILTALAQWARTHADRAGEALLGDGDPNPWSNHAELRRRDIEEWLPRIEDWVRTLRREVGDGPPTVRFSGPELLALGQMLEDYVVPTDDQLAECGVDVVGTDAMVFRGKLKRLRAAFLESVEMGRDAD